MPKRKGFGIIAEDFGFYPRVRLHSLAVRTLPSHGRIMGSSPIGGAIVRTLYADSLPWCNGGARDIVFFVVQKSSPSVKRYGKSVIYMFISLRTYKNRFFGNFAHSRRNRFFTPAGIFARRITETPRIEMNKNNGKSSAHHGVDILKY